MSAQQSGDEHLGNWVYCKSHRRPHTTGWCTVPAGHKIALEANNYGDCVRECRQKRLPVGDDKDPVK